MENDNMNEVMQINSINNRSECANACKYNFSAKPCNNQPCEISQESMLEQLKAYRFAIIELALYLDTHPEDEKALSLHNDYSRRFKMLEEQYQKMFGPLSIMCPCKKWRWLEEPWPWEGGNK